MTEAVYAKRDEHSGDSETAPWLRLENWFSSFQRKWLPKARMRSLGKTSPRLRRSSRKQFAQLGSSRKSDWSHKKEIGMWHSVTTFFLGTEWVTNSSWNDVYGLMPLFSGSCMIALIAIFIAVPFSVASAIYVNQIAGPREQNLIKPTIEFIQAIPSIVLGFLWNCGAGRFPARPEPMGDFLLGSRLPDAGASQCAERRAAAWPSCPSPPFSHWLRMRLTTCPRPTAMLRWRWGARACKRF